MNISDIKINYNKVKGDKLQIIFKKQDELRKKYGIPILDLDLPQDQHLAREFAWNVVEETGEAFDVFATTKDREHLIDELADALSFFVELLIMCGFDAESASPDDQMNWVLKDALEEWFRKADEKSLGLYVSHSDFVVALSLAINNLKNRKWRKTNLKTNRTDFKRMMYETIVKFFGFVSELGIDPETLFDGYLRKHKVNLFRINSKY